ncbi:MAG: hypothetical protein IJ529_04410 [Alphaproteobacteria bacterium]|nr:hypothetical protein [Alphaproteobacteria bacterium]MBQ8677691.1 hypothetical protein [Alphaproteobacteria bacterium]
MKHVIRNLSILACSLSLLSACSSDSPFRSLFGKDASVDYSKNDLPSLGSTNFEPIEVSKVGNTGTLVGQKVLAYRSELTELEDSIKQNNADLQKVRSSVIDNAIDYHNTTAAMEAKLQVGTTPGNPIMYQMLQKTQNNVVVMDENANALNKIYNQAVSDMSVVKNLQDSIRATYGVSGAIDEDHAQLRTLENETSQTAIVINSLISEVGSDYSRQIEYTNTARNYLSSLDRAIKVGSYGVSNTPLATAPSYNLSGAQINVPNRKPHSVRNNVNGKPLFVAKFNKNNVNYKDSLQRTIRAAQSKNGGFRYDVVAVSPVNAGANIRNLAQDQAAAIFEEITKAGVSPDKINLLSKTSEQATSAEVQVFVK